MVVGVHTQNATLATVVAGTLVLIVAAKVPSL